MGKRKNNGPTLDELLDRPFCYYCERDFDSIRILMDHMKAKHLKCRNCNRRLNTAGGLRVHLDQVHKEKLESIDNALANRTDPTIEVFGMEGMPEDVLREHHRRISEAWHKAEHERRAATGNPPPGQTHEHKRQKQEDPAEVKARAKAMLERKKAERAAKAAGLASADTTPQASTPDTQMHDAPQLLAANNSNHHPSPGFNAPYAPNYTQYAHQYPNSPMGQTPFPPPNTYSPSSPAPPYAQHPPQGYAGHGFGQGYPGQGYPGQGYPQHASHNGYGPTYYGAPNSAQTPGFSTPSHSPGQAAFANGRPHSSQRGPPSSMSPQSGQSTSPQTQAPPQQQQQINNLPPPPGLPNRPTFPSPNLTKDEMAAMHAGGTGAPGAVQSIALNRYEKKKAESNRQMISDSVDELIESVTSGAANAKKANGASQQQQHTDAANGSASAPTEAQSVTAPVDTMNQGTEAPQPAAGTAPPTDATDAKEGAKKKKEKKSKGAQKLLANDSESLEELLAVQAQYGTPA